MRTVNQIDVKGPQQKVADRYSCHDLLSSWSPGFISLEKLDDEPSTGAPRFRQRYSAMGREIEEVLTLLENNLPEGLRILADNGGTLTRESSVTFERAEAGYTRVTIENHFRGAHVPTLVEQELWDYTQAFLRVFKTFVETHET